MCDDRADDTRRFEADEMRPQYVVAQGTHGKNAIPAHLQADDVNRSGKAEPMLHGKWCDAFMDMIEGEE